MRTDTVMTLQGIVPPHLWRRKRLKKGASLFHRGQTAGTLFVVVSGAIRLAHLMPDGDASQDTIVAPGRMIGETSFFRGTFSCDALAVEDSEIDYALKRDVLVHFEREPAACLAFARMLSDQVIRLRERMELMQMRSAKDRILAWLTARLGPGRAKTLAIDHPWREVAAHLGLTHEALYRALATLARERRIWREGRNIRLLA
jgi:CRP/FNR family transcriptional regulator, dissimilatory nitrate respiration regulator